MARRAPCKHDMAVLYNSQRNATEAAAAEDGECCDSIALATEGEERDAVIAAVVAHLKTCSLAELHNVARMTHNGALTPASCPKHSLLSHYPLPQTRHMLRPRLTEIFQHNARQIFHQGPSLVQASVDRYQHLLSKLEQCPSISAAAEVSEMSLALASYLNDECSGPQNSETNEEEHQLFPGSAAQLVKGSHAHAWRVWAQFVMLETVFVFAQHLSLSWTPGSDTIPVTIFRTDKMHVACALLHDQPQFLLGHALFKDDHADWERLKKSRSICVQGERIVGDMGPEEMLFDVCTHLGMHSGASAEAQTTFMEDRAEALVWILKLVRQGMFAFAYNAIIKVIFGHENFMRCSAPHNRDGRHQLCIEVFPATESQHDAELRITASICFSVRDETPDMNVTGVIPMELVVMLSIGPNGEVNGFQMNAEIKLDPVLLDEPMHLFPDHSI